MAIQLTLAVYFLSGEMFGPPIAVLGVAIPASSEMM